MKTSKIHFSLLFIFPTLNLFLAQPAEAAVRSSIERLVQNGSLQVTITSTGSHAEECIEFRLKNNTPDSLYGFIEPGRRLESNDPDEQDILIVREEAFALAPNSTQVVKGYGFCCQSSNQSPAKGSGFGLGKMTNDNWQRLAQRISQSNYPADAIQHAIWVFSNGHDIRSIPAMAEGNATELRQFVADELGIVLPWYSFLYEMDSTQVFSGVANKLYADVAYTVPRRTLVTGVIYDKNGRQIYDSPSYYVSEGAHHFQVNVALDQFPEGEYTFRIIEDFDVLNLEKKFSLG